MPGSGSRSRLHAISHAAPLAVRPRRISALRPCPPNFITVPAPHAVTRATAIHVAKVRSVTRGPPSQVLEAVVQALDALLFLRLGIDPVEALAPRLFEGHQVSRVGRGDPLVERFDPVHHLVLIALEDD